MRSRRHRVHDDDDGAEIKDGQSVRVPMFLVDSAQHRPGPVQLSGFQIQDAGLRDAIEARDRAFRDLERRSQNSWRKKFGDARQEPLGAEGSNNGGEETGEPDEDDDETSLEQATRDREIALAERDRIGDQAWKMSPKRADEIEAQARSDRWRHGA